MRAANLSVMNANHARTTARLLSSFAIVSVAALLPGGCEKREPQPAPPPPSQKMDQAPAPDNTVKQNPSPTPENPVTPPADQPAPKSQ